jgi:hypothetical protein
MFKLNKLQASQANSVNGSKAPSPQPPTPNPGVPPRFQQRHAQTMSLAQPVPRQSLYELAGSFNPFGSESITGSDDIRKTHSETPGTPLSELSVPGQQGRPRSTGADGRPDFIRGFGLDIPEEAEEDEAFNFGEPRDVSSPHRVHDDDIDSSVGKHTNQPETDEGDDEERMTAGHSRHHTRHTSRISVALSVKSAHELGSRYSQNEQRAEIERDALDAAGEWTGTEDNHNDEAGSDMVC